MNLFLYLDRNTFIHNLDPRTKIVALLQMFALALTFNDPRYVIVVTIANFVIAYFAKCLINLKRIWYLLIILSVFSTAMWPFFVHGPTVIWQWRFLTLTKESLLYGIAMGLRISTMVISGIIFLSTTKVEEFTTGLIRFRVPYAMAFALSTAIRLVPTFVGAGATIVQAQISRGLDLEAGNVVSRMKKFIPLLVPIFISAIRNTNLLAMALESKGFGASQNRTFYLELKMRKRDWIVLIGFAVINITCIYLRLLGYGEVLRRI